MVQIKVINKGAQPLPTYANNIDLAQQIIAEETTSCGYWYTQVRWNTSNFLEKPDKY